MTFLVKRKGLRKGPLETNRCCSFFPLNQESCFKEPFLQDQAKLPANFEDSDETLPKGILILVGQTGGWGLRSVSFGV